MAEWSASVPASLPSGSEPPVCIREETFLFSRTGIEPQYFGRLAFSLVSVLTELSRLT